MNKKEIQEKLAKIREAKTKNSFSHQKNDSFSDKKATGTSNRSSKASGIRKVGSGD
ncbi:MAG: hypothetical protein ACK5LM_00725 [Lactovum sp.]